MEKKLTIEITGTDRKRKEIERVVRKLLDSYKGKRGVYAIKIGEKNI